MYQTNGGMSTCEARISAKYGHIGLVKSPSEQLGF
jgi:hypothetical protein